jgi:hypothetical protein
MDLRAAIPVRPAFSSSAQASCRPALRRIAAVLPIAQEMVEKLCYGPVNLIIFGIVIPSA